MGSVMLKRRASRRSEPSAIRPPNVPRSGRTYHRSARTRNAKVQDFCPSTRYWQFQYPHPYVGVTSSHDHRTRLAKLLLAGTGWTAGGDSLDAVRRCEASVGLRGMPSASLIRRDDAQQGGIPSDEVAGCARAASSAVQFPRHREE